MVVVGRFTEELVRALTVSGHAPVHARASREPNVVEILVCAEGQGRLLIGALGAGR